MTDPLVSVVIANHNYGDHLSDAIASVQAQTYSHWELIVVDDASTDDSVDIARTAAPNATIIALDDNIGSLAAFSRGFAGSQGEIIATLDSDDWWHPEKLERIVEAHQADPDLTQISHWFGPVDRDGVPVTGWSKNSRIRRWLKHDPNLSTGDVHGVLLRWGRYSWGITSGLSWPREVVAQALAVDPKPRMGVDTYLTIAAAFQGRVGMVEGQLMGYRIHGRNVMGGSSDLSHRLRVRQNTAAVIDSWAEHSGEHQRYDLDSDIQYTLVRFLDGEPVSLALRLAALARTVPELIALRAQPARGLVELIERSIMALHRGHGKKVITIGLNRWLRSLTTRP
ncbi:MAG: glycosyltransferase [Actinomycetia bacterium]|nr:glycosyltransferase [Actinomycetes bacterium]